MRPRLICLPHAGGSARVFIDWQRALEAAFEVRAIELPGHGTRYREPLATRIPPLAREIVATLGEDGARPYVLFGHSMGGLIAHAVAAEAASLGRSPAHVVVAGVAPPHVPRERLHELHDAALLERLREHGGTPREALESDELMSIVLPIVRADLEACAAYRPLTRTLACAITALSGADDAIAPPAAVAGWSAYTARAFEHIGFAGDHFFVHRQRERIFTLLRERVAPLAV